MQKRTQFHSCDRCRQGRRACDAAKRGINPFPMEATNQQQRSSGQQLACSHCERANKACTFTWLRQRTRGQLPESIKRKYLRDAPLAHRIPVRADHVEQNCLSPASPESENVQSAVCENTAFHTGSKGLASTQVSPYRETQSLLYEDRLARELGRDVTSDRLFVVYTSSFERTISKWATPNNEPSGISRNPALHHTLYDRVRRLDRKASALIRRHTSFDHCHRAIRALRLAIMTFASQSSCIRRAENSQGYGDVFVSASDFQSLLFQTLWLETRSSLELFADWDCLESILAKIIFSLTQSPFGYVELNFRREGARRDPHTYDSPEAMALRKAHLDKALQSLSFWKRKMQPLFRDPERLKHLSVDLDDGDITGFCLFVKFAMICDETTAVLWNRSIQIIEEEGDIRWPRAGFGIQSLNADPVVQPGQIQPHSYNGPQNQQPQLPSNNLITVGQFLKVHSLKASLWRKLGQFQRFARRGQAPTNNLETHIQDTLHLFHEWDVSCASYIKNCMASITTAPFDLEASCFGHIAHWHLGVLLFATEVERLDTTGRSDSIRSSLRRSTGLTWELHKDSVYAISDLARAANALATEGLNRQSDTRIEGYYEHPLLVDPLFAVIHVAFSATCEVLLGWRNQLLLKLSNDQDARYSPEQRHQDESYLANISERLSHCVSALDLLGTKSGVSKGYAYDLRARLEMGLY